MMTVFLNGKFYSAGDPEAGLELARIGIFDAAFQHGVGLFETMLGGVHVQGIEGPRSHGEEIETWVLQLDEHIERLAKSAKELGLSQDLRTSALEEVVLETVKRSELERARIRLTITPGDLAMLGKKNAEIKSDGKGDGPKPTVLVVAQPATKYPKPMYERGVSLVLADTRANRLNKFEGHKTLNYWWRLSELQMAGRKGAAEALVLSVSNHLVGGCVSNVILVKDEVVYTPIAKGEEQEIAGKDAVDVMASPVLPGTVRSWVLEKADRLGLKMERKELSVEDLLKADEVMMTNSSWGLLPVIALEGNPVGNSKPGRVTLDLLDAWRELMPEETAE